MRERASQGARRFALSVAAVVLTAAFLSGCGGGLTEKDIPYTRPMIDSIMRGISDNDYAAFSRDISDAMKAKVGAGELDALAKDLQTRLGEYREWSFVKAVKAKGPAGMDMVIVTCRVLFSGESAAEAKVYIGSRNGIQKVEGFMIDSPALREGTP